MHFAWMQSDRVVQDLHFSQLHVVPAMELWLAAAAAAAAAVNLSTNVDGLEVQIHLLLSLAVP